MSITTTESRRGSANRTPTSDLQRLVSRAMWDRKKAAENLDLLSTRRVEQRIDQLLDEFVASVISGLST